MINAELLFDLTDNDFANLIIAYLKNMLDYNITITISGTEYWVKDNYNEHEDIYTLSLQCRDKNEEKEIIHLVANGVDGPTPYDGMDYEALSKYNNPDHLYILADDKTELFLSFIQVDINDISSYLYSC